MAVCDWVVKGARWARGVSGFKSATIARPERGRECCGQVKRIEMHHHRHRHRHHHHHLHLLIRRQHPHHHHRRRQQQQRLRFLRARNPKHTLDMSALSVSGLSLKNAV